MGILNRERVANYSYIFIAIYLLVEIIWVIAPPGLLDRAGKPKGTDFVGFYAASTLANQGKAVDAYNPHKLHAVEEQVIHSKLKPYTWNYPPTFLLVLAPFSRLPYPLALFLWMMTTLCASLVVIRLLAPHPLTTRAFLAYPGVFQNILQGQNGFLITLLYGGGLFLLDCRPLLAGALLGLLSFKPQLALLLIVALIAGKRWKCLAAAVVSAAALAGASYLAFGGGPWMAFHHNTRLITASSEAGVYPFNKMPTAFASARLLGVAITPAMAFQTAFALIAFCAVVWVWSRKSSFASRISVLVIGTFLTFPFLYDYDLVLLSLALMVLGLRGRRRGWTRGEEALLLATWSLPVIATVLASAIRVQIAPLVLLALLWITLKRELVESREIAE